MKIRKVNIKFRPLVPIMSIDTIGSVAGSQSYSSDFKEFTPDYTITPLTLQPLCDVIDPDGEIVDPHINASLTNMSWTEIVNGTKSLITDANTKYAVTRSGDKQGRIMVKRNASPASPITLFFKADYIDPRTEQIHVFQRSYLILCNNTSEVSPVLMIDSASTVQYDPFTDPKRQTIKSLLMISDKVVVKANRKFFWSKKEANGSIAIIGADDYEIVSISDDTLIIDRELMGSDITIVCQATYSNSGKPSPSAVASDPTNSTTIVRQLRYNDDYDYSGVPDGIASGTTAVRPELYVTGPKGVITNPMDHLYALWYTKTNVSAGKFVQVGHGAAPSIPTKSMDNVKGMQLGIVVEDCGPLLPWGDNANGVIVDNLGNIILIK